MDTRNHREFSDGEYSDVSNTAEPYYFNDEDHDIGDNNEPGRPSSASEKKSISDDVRSDRASSRSGRHSRHHKRSHKSKHRKKHRRQYSCTSSSSASRSRSRERHHRHGRHRRRSPTRSPSWSSDSRGSQSDNDRYHRSRNRDVYGPNQTPTNTIMIRGLPLSLTEKEISMDLVQCGISTKEVRLIRHRDSGLSRGFCFIEFHSVGEARKYMELKKGTVVYQDEYPASMIYSVGRAMESSSLNSPASDWHCSKCSSYNFKRRDYCFRCQAMKPDDGTEEIKEELSKQATTTLLLQNLDMLTTEDSIQLAFDFRSDLKSIPVKSMKISREPQTNLSRGICFVETNTVSDAVRFYDALIQNPLMVDERTLRVAYCKPPVQAVSLNSAAAAALAAAQWSTSLASTATAAITTTSTSPEAEIKRLAEYSASLYAKNAEEKASFLSYYLGYYRNQHSQGQLNGTNNWDAGLTGSASTNHSGESNTSVSASGNPQPAVSSSNSTSPDLSRLCYDESTACYYDSLTGFYYDGANQRYYDPAQKEFVIWNSKKRTYEVVQDTTEVKSKIEKPSKIKASQTIVKDTLREAAKFNDKRSSGRDHYSGDRNESSSPPERSLSERVTDQEKQTPRTVSFRSHVTTTHDELEKSWQQDAGGESGQKLSTKTPPSNSAFMDLQKLACTLCKRQFPSLEVLTKHTQLSQLHKTNLANQVKTADQSFSTTSGSISGSYRDRAKERRNFFGPEDSEPTNTLKERYMDSLTVSAHQIHEEEPPRIEEDNVGNRLLQKMGWKSGKGLGKNETGRTDIIKTEIRAGNVGLGHKASPLVQISSQTDRYSKARHLTLARYRELDD